MPSKQLPGPPCALSRSAFISTYGAIYEHSPWIAERLYDSELTQRDNLADRLAHRMAAIVDAASDTEKRVLIRAHPDLVGKTAIAGKLTKASREEQNSAALDQCTTDEFAEFQQLNQDYKNKFGFPFIFAVAGFHRREILKAFRQRIGNEQAAEFCTALEQIHRIALLRLRSLEQ